MLELNHLYNMDCMDGMRQFPDKYFELAIVDPPYGIKINHNMGRRKQDKKSGYKKVLWDDKSPSLYYFNELFRVSVNQIIWGANYFFMPPCKCFIVWRKPQISENMSFSMLEYAWTSFGETSKEFIGMSNEPDRIHPTQKPVKLYEWILNRYAKKGDKILDTHVGSASSLIACYKQLIARTSRPRPGIKPRDLTDKEIEALHGEPVTVQCGKSIAERIKLARGTISQRNAAEKCDTSSSTWCQWETGKTAPRKSSVKAIAKALEVREAWILTGIGAMYDKEQVESTPVVTHSEQITYTAPGLKITMGGTYTGAVVSTLLSGLRADGKYKVQIIVEDLRDGE